MGILSAFRFAFQNLFFSPILYGVIASLAVFSTVWESGDRLKDQLTDRLRSQDDTFDFIIVGGGSSGAVLANRLSQFHTVLLLEAGGETHPFQAIPGLSIFIPKNPGTDYMHKSVTQTKSCFACPHKKYILSQGKNLGGTGNLNYMIHMRGNPLDFDNWATITGDPTWSYEGVLPYFIQSEHFVGKTSDKEAHGHGGPLQIEIPDCIGLANEWNSAGAEMGYSHVDLNGRHSEGFDTIFYPIKRGLRQATYRSYIQPVRRRPSLLIRKFAHVNKVLIREGTNEAFGVEYDRHGHKRNAFANKEVILSAGALQTPKLLVLSGVGQLEHLTALHIPVKSVLPVGKNLQDHFSTLLGPFYINTARTISFDRDVDKQSFLKFALSGKGPLTTTGFMATAVLASSVAKAEGQDGWPDIQLSLFGLTPHRMFYSDIGHAFGIRPDILHKYYGDADGKENAFFIMVTLARPLSKGDYCLPSKNPYKPPQIDPNYLMDPLGHDVQVMIEGIHRALYLAENTTAFRALDTLYSQKCFPGCDNVPFRSDLYWECYIRSFSVANNDHVGTCPMGKVGSPYAVVDPQLRVQGIQRLRVVDASIMPTIVGAPTQASTIMIAEKASALILNEWKKDGKSFYGPPGIKPGSPVPHYGPPLAPGNNIGPQYGPPGLKPAPVSGGDGFENYDSFTVIRDQFNPNPNGVLVGPTPTPLIPINPNTQLWSTPEPFPNIGASPIPAFINGGITGTLSTPQLTPEPSIILLPPEDSLSAPGPTFATSYSSSNIDYNGPIVSTTPNYPVSFHLDTSRSEKTSIISEAEESNNTTGQRQGKSFGIASSTVSSLPEGNQLGQGLDEQVLPTVTPAPSPAYYSTPSPTSPIPYSDVTEEVISEGPDFRVVRKRLRTTPRVVVHPRGHLGHQNIPRKTTTLNESLESLFLTTSSHRPVPKDIVKIKRRRPGRRRTTTPAPTDSSFDTSLIASYSNNGIEQNTTSKPASQTAALPSELKSPGKKRFVRRMYIRPLNFNGKRRFQSGRNRNDLIAQATAATPITVTLETFDVSRRKSRLKQDVFQERIDLDTSASFEDEITTTEPSQVESDNNDDDLDDETDDQGGIIEPNSITNSTSGAIDEISQPVIVFKNIELEDIRKLNRQTRRANKSDYFGYNLLAQESRNPIMAVDLNPIPEILAPKAKIKEDADDVVVQETVAINLDDDQENDNGQEVEEDVDIHEDNYEEDSTEDFTEEPIGQNVITDAENTNKSSNVNSLDEIKSQSSLYTPIGSDNQENLSYEVEGEDDLDATTSPSISESDYSPEDISSSKVIENVTTTSSSLGELDSKISERSRVGSTANKVGGTSTMSPRYMFRAKNKLLRIHS